MSARDTWMPLYVPDYLRDTGHLSATEHGAYLLLLMAAWTRDGVLPADEERLRRLARVERRDWAKAREAVLAFFVRDGDTLRNPRLDIELERAASIIAERRKSGRAGAEKRWNINAPPIANGMANGMANTMANASQIDAPLPLQKKEKKERISTASQSHPSGKPPGLRRQGKILPGFEEFWRHYPRKVGRGAAEKAWPKALDAADGDPETIIAGVKIGLALSRFDLREEGQFCPHPSTWLNAKRWLDGLEPDTDDQPSMFRS